MIQPTTRFGQIRAQRTTYVDKTVLGDVGALANAVNCKTSITPSCLRSLYKVPSQPVNGSGATGFMAFNNFLEQVPRFNDLESFEAEYAPYANGQSFTTASINGGSFDQSSQADSGEANLDAQYLLALGAPVPMAAYATSGRGPLIPDLDQPNPASNGNEPYLDFLNYILALPDNQLPHTLSTSYGEDEQSVPLSYRLAVCNMFGQLGARGVSVLFSSGDTGCGAACQTNDGKNTTRFLPIFPAACPYVTSVGGTYSTAPERAIGFSSGGFSDTWARPAWQNAAVTTYLNQLGSTWAGLYNRSGRGFPDVAAQSSNFHVIDKQVESQLSGTSASAPAFAGIISLLNANRLQAGKPPLGFLNPWIYSAAYKGLVDITNGKSTGCTGRDQYSGLPTPYIPNAGWSAVPGWDPVTGYGTPDYSKLLPLAMAASGSSSSSRKGRRTAVEFAA
jgi:tripeptidyl-peptidase-1